MGGYDNTEGGFISLRASNGSLRADFQDLICVYRQPGSQKKGAFLGVWRYFRLMGPRLDNHQTKGGLKQLLCLHLAAGGNGRIGGRNMRVREEYNLHHRHENETHPWILEQPWGRMERH